MTYALILSGGIGSRVGNAIPKQYLEIDGKPIILYCLEVFSKSPQIDGIIISASDIWRDYLKELLDRYGITKFMGFADAGDTRQNSVLNGFHFLNNLGVRNNDFVLVHDAVRPFVSENVITACIEGLKNHECCLPAVQEVDSVYVSEDKKCLTGKFDRDKLFRGQTPECFHFGSYYNLLRRLSDRELAEIRGCCELALKNNLDIGIVSGSELLYKITTAADLEKFKRDVFSGICGNH